MAALTVWRFDSVDGAERAEAILLRMAREGDIDVLDAATVSWPAGASKPRTRRLTDLTGEKAGWGAFWGFLFGLLFFMPLVGAAAGATKPVIAVMLGAVRILSAPLAWRRSNAVVAYKDSGVRFSTR